jgi:hypothetical protein
MNTLETINAPKRPTRIEANVYTYRIGVNGVGSYAVVSAKNNIEAYKKALRHFRANAGEVWVKKLKKAN